MLDFAEGISATTTTTTAATATDRRLLPPPPPLPLLLLPIATWLPYLTSEPRKNPWTSRPDGCAAFFDLTVVQHSASLYTCNESRHHHPPDVSNVLRPATRERLTVPLVAAFPPRTVHRCLAVRPIPILPGAECEARLISEPSSAPWHTCKRC